MNKASLWILSFLITAVFALFQRTTGPTYPVRGSLLTPSGIKVSYRLPRSCTIGGNDCVLKLKSDKPLSGVIEWKRYKTADAVTAVPFTASPDRPCPFAPDQPPAGKLEYAVYAVENGARSLIGPQKVVTRFKGAVPGRILIPHIFFMFFFMLFSVRIALSALMNQPVLKHTILLNLFFLAAGGFVLGIRPVAGFFGYNLVSFLPCGIAFFTVEFKAFKTVVAGVSPCEFFLGDAYIFNGQVLGRPGIWVKGGFAIPGIVVVALATRQKKYYCKSEQPCNSIL